MESIISCRGYWRSRRGNSIDHEKCLPSKAIPEREVFCRIPSQSSDYHLPRKEIHVSKIIGWSSSWYEKRKLERTCCALFSTAVPLENQSIICELRGSI